MTQEILAQNRKKKTSLDNVKEWILRLSPYIGLIIFFAIWEVWVTLVDIPEYLLPTPSRIWEELIKQWDNIIEAFWFTAYEMILGYILAIVIAVPLAIGITFSKGFDRFITPILLLFQTIPKIALAPLFLVWFGFGILPKVLVAFLISFFPIIIDTAVGLRSIHPDMIDLAKSMGASQFQIFMRFRLPTSLPYLFSGLKVASTLAVVGAVVGEFVGADRGLGYLLLRANSNLQTALMFDTILALSIQGLAMYYLIQFLESLLIPWHISVRSAEAHGTM